MFFFSPSAALLAQLLPCGCRHWILTLCGLFLLRLCLVLCPPLHTPDLSDAIMLCFHIPANGLYINDKESLAFIQQVWYISATLYLNWIIPHLFVCLQINKKSIKCSDWTTTFTLELIHHNCWSHTTTLWYYCIFPASLTDVQPEMPNLGLDVIIQLHQLPLREIS